MEQPQSLGRFFLFRSEESNGYRTVYRAGLARGRAIERIIRLELFDRPGIDPGQLLNRLEASSGLQDKLRDPHIVPGAGVGQVDGTPYAAYDFELGTTLSTFLSAAREQSFPVPFDQALFVGERIALALAAAYRLEHNDGRVLHSFLTPDSVLLSNEGEVKVSGFEVAHALREQLAGSPFCAPYLSPKSRAGQAPVDHDDVFSLGSILFELVTGEPLSIESVDLDHSIVKATGEPVPENLRLLLEGSFAPPASRIPNVVAWQQNLGRVILDGEHNPTTFNLAFLMHTLLRDPLDRGAEHLAQEKQFLLPQRREEEQTQAAAAVVPTADSSVPTRANRAFWFGFSISGVTASALLVFLLTLGSGSNEAPTGTLAAPANAMPLTLAENQVSPAPASGEARSASPTQQASVTLTEVVNGELGRPSAEAEFSRAVEQTAEIERLKAEYELELDRLRTQISAIEQSKPAAETEGAPFDPPTDRRTGVSAAIRSETRADPTPQPEVKAEPTPAILERSEPAAAVPAASESAASEPTQAESLGEPRPEPSGPAPSAAVETDPAISLPQLTQPEAAAEQAGGSPEAAAAPTSAHLLRLTPPTYPVAARRLGLSATARVKVLISPRGKVKQAEIIGPRLGSGFDAAALTAVRRSRWQPATRDGEPIESWNTVTLEFQP